MNASQCPFCAAPLVIGSAPGVATGILLGVALFGCRAISENETNAGEETTTSTSTSTETSTGSVSATSDWSATAVDYGSSEPEDEWGEQTTGPAVESESTAVTTSDGGTTTGSTDDSGTSDTSGTDTGATTTDSSAEGAAPPQNPY